MKIEDLMIKLAELDKKNKDDGIGMTADQVLALLPQDMLVMESFPQDMLPKDTDPQP